MHRLYVDQGIQVGNGLSIKFFRNKFCNIGSISASCEASDNLVAPNIYSNTNKKTSNAPAMRTEQSHICATDQKCNLNYFHNCFLFVDLLNLRAYASHLISKHLCELNGQSAHRNIECIPKSTRAAHDLQHRWCQAPRQLPVYAEQLGQVSSQSMC